MESQDLIKIGSRAKSETEAFINRHINDGAKGWPKNYLRSADDKQYPQEQQVAKGGDVRIFMAQ